MKIAIIGCRHGHIFSLYQLLKESDRVEFAGAYEADEAARLAAEANQGMNFPYHSIDEILADETVDAVALGDYYGARGAQAIAALKASNTDASREAARYWVQQTDEKQCRFELVYAHAALSSIGTAEDVELLERHANSRLQDVKSSALYAIDQIQRRENKVENKPISAIRKFFRKSQKKT